MISLVIKKVLSHSLQGKLNSHYFNQWHWSTGRPFRERLQVPSLAQSIESRFFELLTSVEAIANRKFEFVSSLTWLCGDFNDNRKHQGFGLFRRRFELEEPVMVSEKWKVCCLGKPPLVLRFSPLQKSYPDHSPGKHPLFYWKASKIPLPAHPFSVHTLPMAITLNATLRWLFRVIRKTVKSIFSDPSLH